MVDSEKMAALYLKRMREYYNSHPDIKNNLHPNHDIHIANLVQIKFDTLNECYCKEFEDLQKRVDELESKLEKKE